MPSRMPPNSVVNADNSIETKPQKLTLGFWALVALLLAIVAVLEVSSITAESQTHDEAAHIAAGYSYWTTGDFRLNAEHPPLSKLLATIPLFWWAPRFSPPANAWRLADEFEVGKDFLYHSLIPADTALLATRSVTMLLSALLAVSLAWWVGSNINPTAGIVALLLFSLEPTVLAHSRYVTSDLPVTFFFWLACISWCAYLEGPSRLALLRSGLLTGLAIATKFNAMALPLIFILTWFLYSRAWPKHGLNATRTGISLMVISFFVIYASYGFDTRSIREDPILSARLARAYPNDALARSPILAAALRVPVPAYYFFRGLHLVVRHNQSGHLTYLNGSINKRGSWKYFPTAITVKTPIGWLLLLGLAMIRVASAKGKWPGDPREQWLLDILLVPTTVYFAISLLTSINIGIRHLLPIYPFVCAFIASVLFGKRQAFPGRALSLIFLLAFVVEASFAYPNYLSYFNAGAGGGRNGYHYLLDSNLDWGQDLKRLKAWLETHDAQPFCLSYFGTVDVSYYGIQHEPLGMLQNDANIANLNCVVAISAEHLFGLPNSPFSALRTITATDRVGDSIFVYDLRRKRAHMSP
jgi:hypothetical protein